MHHEAPRKLQKTFRKLPKIPRGCKTLQEISGRSRNLQEAQEVPGKLERVPRWLHHCSCSCSNLAQALPLRPLRVHASSGWLMDLLEGEWVDGEIASVPVTSSGCIVVWQVFTDTIHGTENWADYKPHENLRMDAALKSDNLSVTLQMNGGSWTIDLKEMVQVNNETGKRRPIRRTVIVKPCLSTG